MRTENGRTLPKTDSVHAQWLPCGKPTCRCARGQPHGPYHYAFVRQDGRLVKRYIKLAEAPSALAMYEARRDLRRRGRAAKRAWFQEWRATKALLREIERHE